MASRSKSPRDIPSVSPKKSPSARLVGRIVEREAASGKSGGSRGSREAANGGLYRSGDAMKGMQIRGYLGRR